MLLVTRLNDVRGYRHRRFPKSWISSGSVSNGPERSRRQLDLLVCPPVLEIYPGNATSDRTRKTYVVYSSQTFRKLVFFGEQS